MRSRAELLFAEELNALHHISEKNSSDFVSSQHIAELKAMLQKEKEDFEVVNFFIFPLYRIFINPSLK